jgi:hypothetical protein
MTTVKAEAMEILKSAKMAELKELANKEGWATYWTAYSDLPEKDKARKVSFIGVTKAEVMEYIADIQQQKADIAIIEECEKEQELLGNDNVQVITLKEVASILGTDEKALRRKLRNKDMKKPGGRWEWKAGDAQLEEILKWKKA